MTDALDIHSNSTEKRIVKLLIIMLSSIRFGCIGILSTLFTFGGDGMDFSYFIPIPSANAVYIISVVMVIVALFVCIVGLLLLKRRKRAGYVCLTIGGLLFTNHTIQLLI